MGVNTLTDKVQGTDTVNAADINEIHDAIQTDFVPRDSDGTPDTDVSHDCGTNTYPWRNMRAQSLTLGAVGSESTINASDFETGRFRIVSGRISTEDSESELPDFIRASGSGSYTILATATNLELTISGVSVTVDTDIVVSTGLTAAPSTNNTALVNNSTITNNTLYGAPFYHRENLYGSSLDLLAVDTEGSEWTSRPGQTIAFQHDSTSYCIGRYAANSHIFNVYREYFLDENGDFINATGLSNNETLTLMNLGWVFLDQDGSTVETVFKEPLYWHTEPSSPATGDYWFDSVNELWKRYNGSTWATEDKMHIGFVVVDASGDVVASRSRDFTRDYKKDRVGIKPVRTNNDVFVSRLAEAKINVYGKQINYSGFYRAMEQYSDSNQGSIVWSLADSNYIEDGGTRATNTRYFFYITSFGSPVISARIPFYFPHLGGFYHPFKTWRCVGGWGTNGGNSNWREAHDDAYAFDKIYPSAELPIQNAKTSASSETLTIPANVNSADVLLIGGGSGSDVGTGGATGGAGGTTSFGSFCSATGGGATDDNTNQVGTGGVGVNGDLNLTGATGIDVAVAAQQTDFSPSSLGLQRNAITYGMGNANPSGFGFGFGAGVTATGNGVTGGGGGTCIKLVDLTTTRALTVTVGGGGTKGSGGSNDFAGTAGICIAKFHGEDIL